MLLVSMCSFMSKFSREKTKTNFCFNNLFIFVSEQHLLPLCLVTNDLKQKLFKLIFNIYNS